MTAQLQTLRSPPNQFEAQEQTKELISNLVSKPINASQLNTILQPYLDSERVRSTQLTTELNEATTSLNSLLVSTKDQLVTVLSKTKALKESHEVLEDGLIDHREALVSSSVQRDQGEGTGITLREKLEALSNRRKELQVARDWFAVLARAEELGLSALSTLETDLPTALEAYVSLVDYIKKVNEVAPSLALSSHLGAMAGSVWTGMVKVLSTHLVEKLDGIAWPTPIKEPLDWTDAAALQFKTSFVNLLTLEKTRLENPLPLEKDLGTKPLLALVPLIHPLLLRFRWHFEGDRGTNRIDKPEYPLSHVLNLLTTHERFINEDIQELLDENGFADVDAVIDFTSLLLPILSARLKHHIPQLLALPPILAHTIYQTLEFDTVLRARNYHPKDLVEGEWPGLSEVILGKKEWYDQWLKGEREFFDSRYYAAISAPEAWQIVDESDYDATDARSAVRPTNSALTVAELAERLSDRYRPLPTVHTLPFLLSLHLPLLSSYAQRITSALDAFESLSFGLILPGALAEGRAATAGIGGIVRLARSVASARWMSEKCAEYGEDAFYLVLYQYLESNDVSVELEPLASAVLSASTGTLFDGVRMEYEKQADRGEELVVRHVVREVLAELKSYLGKRWDAQPPEIEEEPSLSPDLIAPLSLLSALLSTLVASFPATLSITLYRKISSSLSQALYDRLLINRTWSEYSAKKFEYDLENGFLQAAKGAGIKRGVGKGWEMLIGGARIMALPAGVSAPGVIKSAGFSKVMQIAFDDGVGVGEGDGSDFQLMMESLGVSERLRKKDVQSLMKRRPECWRA